MTNKICLILLLLAVLATDARAVDWEQEIDSALQQAPTQHKRGTNSGRRLLMEKEERIGEIDEELRVLMGRGDHETAVQVLRESLRLSIELYGTYEDIKVAERFVMIGIAYMEAENPREAKDAFMWALKIGEPLIGSGSYQLSNVYRFISAACYQLGEGSEAMTYASLLLEGAIDEYGPNSAQVTEAKAFMKKLSTPAQDRPNV